MLFSDMSPAPLVEEAQPDPQLDQLQAVGKAFDALLLTLYRLTHRHNELKQHTEEVFKQVITPYYHFLHIFPPHLK